MNGRRFFITWAAVVLLTLPAASFAQQTSMPRPTTDRPLESRISGFENPDRDSYVKPDEVVKALGLKDGEVVADVGAGTGYFSRLFAKAVAPSGTVYAVDIDGEVLGYLAKEAEKENLHNIKTITSHPDDPMLPAKAVDLAFFCDTTHHIAGRVAFYRKLSLGMKDHARMAIIDFPPGSPRTGHKPEELIPRSQAISEAEEAGFKFVNEFNFLAPNFYFLVFEKK